MNPNFEAEVDKHMEENGIYVGAVCCAKCAKGAVNYFIDKYPDAQITITPTDGKAFVVSLTKTNLRAAMLAEENDA